jgi:hypothetical protein
MCYEDGSFLSLVCCFLFPGVICFCFVLFLRHGDKGSGVKPEARSPKLRIPKFWICNEMTKASHQWHLSLHLLIPLPHLSHELQNLNPLTFSSHINTHPGSAE